MSAIGTATCLCDAERHSPYSHSIVPQHRNPAQLLKFPNALAKFTVRTTDKSFRWKEAAGDRRRIMRVAKP